MSDFKLYRKSDGSKRSCASLADFFGDWKEGKEKILYIAPHDDDIVLGAGLLLQLCEQENVPQSMWITSDGSMGYCKEEQKENIAEIRRQETIDSFKDLGISDVNWFNFPDTNLMNHSGRRVAKDGDPFVKCGHTGLQNAYTWLIRKERPTRVFLATGSDYHPDHKAVYQEALISIFHAGGNIWPELGEVLKETPKVYEMALYCDFPTEPNMKISADQEAFEKKLDGILKYQSQEQIAKMVEGIRAGGSVEYFLDIVFNFYSPKNYENSF